MKMIYRAFDKIEPKLILDEQSRERLKKQIAELKARLDEIKPTDYYNDGIKFDEERFNNAFEYARNDYESLQKALIEIESHEITQECADDINKSMEINKMTL